MGLQSTTIYNITTTNLTIQSRHFLSIWNWNFAENQNGYLLKHANRDGYSKKFEVLLLPISFQKHRHAKEYNKGSNDYDYLRGVKKLLRSPWEGEREIREIEIAYDDDECCRYWCIRWTSKIIYDFSEFDFLVFFVFDFLGLYDFFFGLCSSMFLMKRMLDLNSCVFYF